MKILIDVLGLECLLSEVGRDIIEGKELIQKFYIAMNKAQAVTTWLPAQLSLH